MSYPSLTAAADHVVTTLGSELPNVMTESQVFALAITQLFEVDANGEPTAIPLGQSGPFVVEIDSEEILCSSFANGQTGVYFDGTTVGRGYGSTTIAAHEPNAPARVISTSVQSVATGGGGGGGGLPSWFQSGAGDPVATNPTAPSQQGALYFDTTTGAGNTGLWVSPDGVGWVGFGSPNSNDGLTFSDSDFDFALANGASASVPLGIASDTALGCLQLILPNGTVCVFNGSGSPSGTITPNAEGDLYIDSSTPALWQATGTEDTDWSQIGSGGGGSLTTVESYITDDVTGSGLQNLTSVELGAGTWLVTARAAAEYNSGDVAEIFIGPNSASVTGAYASSGGFVNSGQGDTVQSMSLTKSITLTETTTVYLNGDCGVNCNYSAAAPLSSIGNVTGITAVQTA